MRYTNEPARRYNQKSEREHESGTRKELPSDIWNPEKKGGKRIR